MRLIDADATIKSIKNSVYPSSMEYTVAVDIATHMIDSAPTIEPAQGEWTYRNNYGSTESIYDDCYVCSACGRESETTHPFCPLCGAKMKGGV
jgi:rubrerythrin